jgi:hypothetical protein
MEIKVENVMGSLGRNPNPAVAPQPPHLPPSPFRWPMDLTLTIAHSGHFLASPGLCPSTRRPTTAPLAAGPQEKLNLFLHPDISTEYQQQRSWSQLQMQLFREPVPNEKHGAEIQVIENESYLGPSQDKDQLQYAGQRLG